MNKQRKLIIQTSLFIAITLLLLFSLENKNSVKESFTVSSEQINNLKANDSEIVLFADKIVGG